MFTGNFDHINAEAIASLVENSVSEDRSLDFKRDAIGSSDEDKKEFLKDVSALANTLGGFLILGVEDSKGVAIQATGIQIDDPDKEILRLENLLRDGLQPRLPSAEIKWLWLRDNSGFLIIKVGRSWSGPHRVIAKGHDKFYARNSNGTYPLDVDQLRAAFLAQEGIPAAIKKFRKERIIGIINSDTPILLRSGPKYVCHLLPLSAFVQAQDIQPKDTKLPGPIAGTSSWSGRYTLDGYVNYNGNYEAEGQPNRNYSHTYRDGRIESVFCEDSDILKKMQISPNNIEEYILDEVERRLVWFKEREIRGPYYLFLTVLSAKGLRIWRESGRTPYPAVNTERLDFPELVLGEEVKDAEVELRPLFDRFANAFGRERSWSYGPDGRWGKD